MMMSDGTSGGGIERPHADWRWPRAIAYVSGNCHSTQITADNRQGIAEQYGHISIPSDLIDVGDFISVTVHHPSQDVACIAYATSEPFHVVEKELTSELTLRSE